MNDEVMIRALAREIHRSGKTPPGVSVRKGVVISHEATGTPPTITVTISGSSTQVPGIRYLGHFYPAVGDTVFLLELRNQIVAFGRVRSSNWTALTLTNLWVPRPGFYAPSIYLGADGIVKVTGTAWNGTVANNQQFGTIPVGFRPAAPEVIVPLVTNNGYAHVAVFKSGGSVTMVFPAGVPSFNTISINGQYPISGPTVTT